MITTKAIAFPSSRFLSMWTLIEQHSSLRKLQQNNKPRQLPFQQRVSNARSTAALWVRRIRAIQIRIWKTPKKYDPIRSWAWAFQCRRGSVRSGGLCPPWHSLQKKAFERLSRISSATMVKRMITTKAIAAPSRCFLSVSIRIAALLFAEAAKQISLVAAVPTACQQCAKHSNILDRSPRRTSFRTGTGLFLSQGSSPIRTRSITFASKSGQAGRACGCRWTMSRADRPCRDGWRQTLDPKRTNSRRGSTPGWLEGS